MLRYAHLVLTALLMATIVVGCATEPTSPSLAGIRELSKSGEWNDAAEMAQQFLDSNLAASDSEKCEVTYHLTIAHTEMENAEAAEAGLDQFARQCPNLPGVRRLLESDISTMIPSSEQ
jgi:outer membrane PBP1 activator LpoA protein